MPGITQTGIITTQEEDEKALEWFLKQNVILSDTMEKIPIIKQIKGDTESTLKLGVNGLATFLAMYHKEMTPQSEIPQEGRKFRS